MKKNKKILISVIIIIIVIVYLLINNYKTIDVISKNSISKEEIKNMEFVLGGEAVGIKLLATGVLVVGIDRNNTNLEIGDIILKVNNNKIDTNQQLLQYSQSSNGNNLILEVNRKGKIFKINLKPNIDKITNEYKLGLWVKDSSAGVGTITFYEKNTNGFAALGHAITETKENYILPIETGAITKTSIFGIDKGYPKKAGQIKGSISSDILGEIITNTDKGIYGKIYDKIKKKSIQIETKEEITKGEAYIYTTLDGNKISKFKINIEEVLISSTGNKNMIIKIIDEKLISKTGGIVQGMSGSPIVQDGKLIGAVTHVFLNDPTKGYGVFIENMICDFKSGINN